jgi:hypothetical protein
LLISGSWLRPPLTDEAGVARDGPWAVDCSAEGARSASTMVSTRQFATVVGDLHLRMKSEVQVLPGPHPALLAETLVVVADTRCTERLAAEQRLPDDRGWS